MSVSGFQVTGLNEIEKVKQLFEKKISAAIDLGNKTGVNKTADHIAYGRSKNITSKNSTSSSLISRAANILLIPKEHVFYRTFVRGIKVAYGKGRGVKPYASVMVRGNSINVVDLLARDKEAKAMYGFKTRKKGVSGKVAPNLESKVSGARIGGRRGGKVKIAGRTYNNSYLENGAYRASSEKINEYYMKKLGAEKMQLKGKRYMLFQRKNSGQKNPYPVKAVKINKSKVISALTTAGSSAVGNIDALIKKLQKQEIELRLKKLGLKLL